MTLTLAFSRERAGHAPRGPHPDCLAYACTTKSQVPNRAGILTEAVNPPRGADLAPEEGQETILVLLEQPPPLQLGMDLRRVALTAPSLFQHSFDA